MSVALYDCYTKKCADTVVGLELLVCLSTGLRCSLKRFLGPRLIVVIYHVDNVLGVAVNVMEEGRTLTLPSEILENIFR